ncbi:MAG: hypothetical protein WBP58_15075 [Chitinophagaceae bacterium]
MNKFPLQIQFDTTNFWVVNWYYLVALAVSVIGVTIAYKNYRKKSSEKGSSGNKAFSNTNNIPISIVNNVGASIQTMHSAGSGMSGEERIKEATRILFIDDNHLEYKNVSILKKAGWIGTRSVKDITDLDSSYVTEADIIFVDINGVGLKLFEDQGLGLASALKKKYPSKKIVIYSAETTGDRFHQALREVDYCLPKNADAYQFINLIENLMKGNG